MEIIKKYNKNDEVHKSIKSKFDYRKEIIFLSDLHYKVIILIFLILLYIIISFSNKVFRKINKNDIYFNYTNYQNNIINEKIKNESGWLLTLEEAYFINGLIRKFKPKNCLEIGVANGGSSILILNAIKDIKNSVLVSLDLNTKLYLNSRKKTGYRVKKNFPELSKNWILFTGDMPNKFLDKLNIKFDFLFLDTSHVTPGEILNLIEAMPFLNENAIIVLHDIILHLSHIYKKIIKEKSYKLTSTQNYLFSALYGDKVIIKHLNGISNIGAIFLYKNQKEHYLDYFFLLMNLWVDMPSEAQIKDLKIFIKKYYKNDLFLKIFESSVIYNKKLLKLLK